MLSPRNSLQTQKYRYFKAKEWEKIYHANVTQGQNQELLYQYGVK